MDIWPNYFKKGLRMTNFVGLFNSNNLLGEKILEDLSKEGETDVTSSPSLIMDPSFRKRMSLDPQGNNIFIFNSGFLNEPKIIDIEYSERISIELGNLFDTLKELINLSIQSGICSKFLFITTNPSISHMSSFPISPICDEAIHSLLRSLAKELKPFNLSFYGICTEPIFELVDRAEMKTYRKSMKIYALKKSPIKIQKLISLIRKVAFFDFTLISGNVLYVGAGLDQMNF